MWLNVGSESSQNDVEDAKLIQTKTKPRKDGKTTKISSTIQDDLPYTFAGKNQAFSIVLLQK